MGRSRQRWRDRIYQDLRLIVVNNLEEIAKDKEDVIVAAKGLKGLHKAQIKNI